MLLVLIRSISFGWNPPEHKIKKEKISRDISTFVVLGLLMIIILLFADNNTSNCRVQTLNDTTLDVHR